ncbi:hypothetical protein JCM8097_001944 [Rhodosporidiobolus ruineniae]
MYGSTSSRNTQATAFRRAGGKAAFKPGEGGATADPHGYGRGWGNGSTAPPPGTNALSSSESQPNLAQQVAQTMAAEHPSASIDRTQKFTVNPRRALRNLANNPPSTSSLPPVNTDSASSSAWGTGLSPPSHSIAPPLPSQPSHNPHPPPSTSTFSPPAHLPPPMPPSTTSSSGPKTIRADLAKASSSKPAAKPPIIPPFARYQPELPPGAPTTVAPIGDWAQGRSEFSAAKKFRAPAVRQKGYAADPSYRPPPSSAPSAPSALASSTSSWCAPGPGSASVSPAASTAASTRRGTSSFLGGASSAQPVTAASEVLRRSVEGGSATSTPTPPRRVEEKEPGEVKNETHLSKWAPPTAPGTASSAPSADPLAALVSSAAPSAPGPYLPTPLPIASTSTSTSTSSSAAPRLAPFASSSSAATNGTLPLEHGRTARQQEEKDEETPIPFEDEFRLPTPPRRTSDERKAEEESEEKYRLALVASDKTVAAVRKRVAEQRERVRGLLGRTEEEEETRRKREGRAVPKTQEETEALVARMRLRNGELKKKLDTANADRAVFDASAASRPPRSDALAELVKTERERYERGEWTRKERSAALQHAIDAARAKHAALKPARLSSSSSPRPPSSSFSAPLAPSSATTS